MLVDLKQKSQVTIPSQIASKLNLKVGDKFELEEVDGKLVMTPVLIIAKEQAWFYKKKWQQEEREVDQQIKKGETVTTKSKEDLFRDLELDNM